MTWINDRVAGLGRARRRPPVVVVMVVGLGGLALSLVAGVGCQKEGCLAGNDPECVVPSPCLGLGLEQGFSCSSGSGAVDVHVIEVGEDLSGSPEVLASPGDVLLSSDQVRLVIDALDHPHYLAPSGGSILDFTTATVAGRNADSLRNVMQATGVLPEESAYYTEMRLIDGGGEFAAVQFRGYLDGRPDMPIATRYEVRPCEPGVRIRTELVNLEPDPVSLLLMDGYFYGGKGILPFTSSPGTGFDHPAFGLSTLSDGITESPYLVTAAHAEPASSYATVACNARSMFGFHSEQVTVSGLEPRVLMPGDYQVFERFIAVVDGPQVFAATDLALELRELMFDEPWVQLTGQLQSLGSGSGLDQGLRAAVLVSEGTTSMPREERIPWTHAIPDAGGNIDVRVPPDRSYVLEVESHGVVTAEFEVEVGGGSTDFGVLEIPGTGTLTIDVTVDGAQDHAQVFVLPADDETYDAVVGTMWGHFYECAPLLDNPHGPSPGCDRALVDGPVTLDLLPGTYDAFATAGPFTSMAVQRGLEVGAGTAETVELEIETLPLLPAGTLSADLHVHGATSFDSTIPDDTRVAAFLASRVDVIAATDHNVTGDYSEMVELMGVQDRVAVIPGIEATGNILFKFTDTAEYPQVMGHWNLWPMPYDPDAPYLGAAWDQKALPGEIFTRMRDAGWPEDTGVIQLNHPISYLEFGRDLGWVTAIGLQGNEDIPAAYDGTLPSLFFDTPAGADFANSAYHGQEVMNGTENDRILQTRALWFFLLDQGVLRAGTANSDSHGLSDSVLGTPRNLVWADTDVAAFDVEAFDDAVRGGRMLGTNGPVIQVSVDDGSGQTYSPGLTPIENLGPGATLHIVVDAAPWVPVDEVRIIVAGQTVRTLTDELDHPDDPLGLDGLTRLDLQLPLDDLVPGDQDTWLVVEAGHALEPNADLNCDGWPDTGDNNGDGSIDWRDVEELDEDPGQDCLTTVGPLANPPPPDDRQSTDYLFRAVTPKGYVFAFTNPLVFDHDGDGYRGVGR